MLISKTINAAMRKIGVLTAQDEAAPADHQLGLETLNRIIDSYNTQNLLITYIEDIALEAPYTVSECEVTPEELATVSRAWKSSVTIGHCEDINMAAPAQIEYLFWRLGTTDYKSEEMAYNQWADVVNKNDVTIPRRHYIQRMDNNSIKIYFDYIPQEGLELHILAKRPYTGVNSVGNEYLPTDDINWNFGFEKMLMYRLAVELSPDFEVIPSQLVVSLATEAENNVKAHNFQPVTLDTDVSLNKNVLFSGHGLYRRGRG